MRRWLIVVGVLSLLVSLALVVIGIRQSAPAAVDPVSAATPTAPSPTESPAPSETPAPTPTRRVIPPSVPSSFSFTDIGFSVPVRAETLEEMAASYNSSHPGENVRRAVYASSFTEASWPSNWRGAPGSDPAGTIYLVCHSSAIADLPCNALAKPGVVQVGQTLIIATNNGDVEVRMTSVEDAVKLDLTNDPRVQEDRAGKVLLMVCRLSEDGRRTTRTWLYTGEVQR